MTLVPALVKKDIFQGELTLVEEKTTSHRPVSQCQDGSDQVKK
jgi:hypothetical protein